MTTWPFSRVDFSGIGIAAALLPHRSGVQRRGAHLAGDSLAADVEADRAADLAGVGDRDDVAIGLFEEEEAYLGGAAFAVVDAHAVAVELVVVDGGGRQGDLGADQRDGRRWATAP